MYGVLLDTVDLMEPTLQDYLEKHEIKATKLGDVNGNDEVLYIATEKHTLMQLIVDIFDDNSGDLTYMLDAIKQVF